eukprot:76333_1
MASKTDTKKQCITGETKLKLLINGYIRQQKGSDDLLTFAMDIIFRFALYFVFKYMDTLVSPIQHTSLGKKSDKENKELISFPKDSFWYFDDKKCLNCFKTNCLIFTASYRDENDPNNCSDKKNRNMSAVFYNVCNEYQCTECWYFISHIIKTQYLKYKYYNNGSSRRSRWSRDYITMKPSITPNYQKYKNEKSDHNMSSNTHSGEIGNEICVECGNKMIIVERWSSYSSGRRSCHECTRKQDYCKNCQLKRFYLCSSKR